MVGRPFSDSQYGAGPVDEWPIGHNAIDHERPNTACEHLFGFGHDTPCVFDFRGAWKDTALTMSI
ncbi:hypothetical protein ACQ5SK_14805 [Bradyrhizobium japonicum]